MPDRKTDGKRTALILPGAGARGRFQAGSLKAVADSKVKIHLMSGTSSGGLNGAMFHQGAINELIDLWMHIKNSDVYRPRPWHLLGKNRYVFDTTPLANLITKLVQPHVNAIPYFVNATDVETLRSKTFFFNAFPIAAARELLRASAALPLLFPSVTIWNRQFVDGGLGRNLPLTKVLRMGAKRIIVLQPAPDKVAGRRDDLIEEFSRIIGMFEIGITQAEIQAVKNAQRIDPSIELIMVRPEHDPPNGLLQFGLPPRLAKGILDDGYETARTALKVAGLWTP